MKAVSGKAFWSVSCATLVTIILFSGTAFAQSASTQIETQNHNGFTIAPLQTNSYQRHGYELQLTPGAQTEQYAYIKNFSSSPQHFSLYGADPTVSNTGSPAYKTRDQSIDGPGTWIKFDEPEIELAGGEEKTARFIVYVPPATPPGEYRAGVTIEKGKQQSNVPGISIATRMISQAKIKVAGSAQPSAQTASVETAVTETAPLPLWKTYYFWISAGLFIISLALLVWALLHEKKSKRAAKSGAHAKPHAPRGAHAKPHPQSAAKSRHAAKRRK